MTDTRELICRRLEKIAARIPGVAAVARMSPHVNTEDGTTVVLFDGPEQRDLDDRRPGKASTAYTMRPEFHIYAVAQPGEAGKGLNKLRAAAIKAVVFDAELETLAGANGRVQYLGCEPDATRGAAIQADMAMIFAITYVLNPNLL